MSDASELIIVHRENTRVSRIVIYNARIAGFVYHDLLNYLHYTSYKANGFRKNTGGRGNTVDTMAEILHS